jgi:hypothetical protein
VLQLNLRQWLFLYGSTNTRRYGNTGSGLHKKMRQTLAAAFAALVAATRAPTTLVAIAAVSATVTTTTRAGVSHVS